MRKERERGNERKEERKERKERKKRKEITCRLMRGEEQENGVSIWGICPCYYRIRKRKERE